jgi:hypothetical protein
MKVNNMIKKVTLIAALLAFAATTTNAMTESQLASVKKAFAKVPVPELAMKAAQMVAVAPAADRQEMAKAEVQAIIAKNPAVAVVVVSAICAAAPDVAPAVSAAAAEMLKDKDSAELIAIAAAKAAPAYAEQIAQAVEKAVPGTSTIVRSRIITTMRAAAAPSGSGTITIQPGVISANTPATAPSTPVTPVAGYDPLRYQSP